MKAPSTGILFFCLIISFQLYAQEEASKPTIIQLEDAIIIDGETQDPFKGFIVIEGQKIKQVGQGTAPEAPAGALVLNLEGFYIVPGYIDSHVHFGTDPSGSDNLEVTKKRLRFFLENGITSVRDMAGDTRYLSYLQRSASLNEIISPDLYFSSLMAGPEFFDDPRTHSSAKGAIAGEAIWMRGISNDTDIKLAVAEAKGTGASGIKIYADLEIDIVRKIVVEAHSQGMKVWSHATIFPAKPLEIVLSGMDAISHATLLAWESAEYLPGTAKKRYVEQENFDSNDPKIIHLLNAMKQQGTILDATLATYKNERFEKIIYPVGVAITKKAYEIGVKIGVGTDIDLFEIPPVAPLFKEMSILVNEIGMSPMEVIQSSTLVNAEILGIEDLTGSIKVGKQADIVVLKENPLMEIENAAKIKYVIKKGLLVLH